MGGSHQEPLLATVQGDYGSVVEFALGLRGFFTWGGGGRIEKTAVIKVDEATQRQRAILIGRQQTLKEQLAEVEAELKDLGVV
jgi:hypothetical protein